MRLEIWKPGTGVPGFVAFEAASVLVENFLRLRRVILG